MEHARGTKVHGTRPPIVYPYIAYDQRKNYVHARKLTLSRFFVDVKMKGTCCDASTIGSTSVNEMSLFVTPRKCARLLHPKARRNPDRRLHSFSTQGPSAVLALEVFWLRCCWHSIKVCHSTIQKLTVPRVANTTRMSSWYGSSR